MLISIPSIAAVALVGGIKLYQAHDFSQTAQAEYAVGTAFLFSLCVIFAMMKWLKKSTYLPFVIYRIILGLCLILL
jgi:undecaprenyl-diphosphatase